MGLETAPNYPGDLNEDWPIGTTEFVSEGDNHLRNVKRVVRRSLIGVEFPLVYGTMASGDGLAYTMTPGVPILAYVTDMRVSARIGTVNTGTVTLEISGLGPKAFRKYSRAGVLVEFAAGELLQDDLVEAVYNGTLFVAVRNARGTAAGRDVGTAATELPTMLDVKQLEPPGIVKMYAGLFSTVPANWAVCDGSAMDSVADTTLATLFTNIGVFYGGTGASNFLLPNFNGRSPVGEGQGPQTAEGGGPGLDWSIGETGGEDEHTLSANESGMPGHSHSYTTGALKSSPQGEFASSLWNSTAAATTGNTGPLNASVAHPNFHPVLTVNFIIKLRDF